MTATERPIVCKIVSGPSREELFDSLRLSRERRTVTFKFEISPKKMLRITAQVRSIGAEDGSGQSWCIIVDDPDRAFGRTSVEGYYRTDSRKGHFDLSDLSEEKFAALF